MRGKAFIDTNVLIYSFDSKNPQKQTTAKKLLKTFFDKDDYFISIQVLNEFGNRGTLPIFSERSLPATDRQQQAKRQS